MEDTFTYGIHDMEDRCDWVTGEAYCIEVTTFPCGRKEEVSKNSIAVYTCLRCCNIHVTGPEWWRFQ